MRKSQTLLSILALLLLFDNLSRVQSQIEEKRIVLQLERESFDPWEYDQEANKQSVCFTPKQLKKKEEFEAEIQMSSSCKNKPAITYERSCTFNNLYLTTKVYLGSKKLTADRKYKPFNLAIDFNTPFSWVKSSQCETATRNGETIKNGGCKTLNATQLFDCADPEMKCKVEEKCAQMIYTYEGLVLEGSFIRTKLRFKDLGKKNNTGLREFKLVQTHQLSGMEYFKADGVLGLGQQYDEDVVELEDEQDIDDYKFEELESLLESTQKAYDDIEDNVFSIFLADTTLNQYSRVLIFGKPDLSRIHDPKKNQLLQVPLLPQNPDDFFLWKIQINSIKFQSNNQSFTETIEDFDEPAVISLSTTALVMPAEKIDQFNQMLQRLYKIDCSISARDLNFVVCTDLEGEFMIKDLNITIQLGQQGQVPVYVNPEYLVQKCRKVKHSSYSCILNVQLSYDGVTILGESILANSYVVFNPEKREVGFAPAKSVYNENILSVIIDEFDKTVIKVAEEVEYDIEFIIRFSVVIFLILLALVAFRNIDKISTKIQAFLNGKGQPKAQEQSKLFQDVSFSSFQEAEWQTEEGSNNKSFQSINIHKREAQEEVVAGPTQTNLISSDDL